MNMNYMQYKRVPHLLHEVYVSLDGKLHRADGVIITVDDFNALTGLAVKTAAVLVALTYQRTNLPPVYWRRVVALNLLDEIVSPETILLAPDGPIESVEYPGYYVIPYFSNYLVTREGALLKRSTGQYITASRNPLGYYTFRMTDDSGHTQNQLRHRILCLTFKAYSADVDKLDVNHRDGVPGNDHLENLEWVSRGENIDHALALGLRSDGKPVEIRDVNTGKVTIFPSCSALGRHLGVTETTVSNRARGNGCRAYNGYQFRYYTAPMEWPKAVPETGGYRAVFEDGSSKECSSVEAARLAGLTRTSLLRALREGRNRGPSGVVIQRSE